MFVIGNLGEFLIILLALLEDKVTPRSILLIDYLESFKLAGIPMISSIS